MKHRMNMLFYCMYKNAIHESRRYAGHSKWQNIKHTKQEQDTARSKLFNSILSKMTFAVKEAGSADPVTNSKLANLISEAKKVNMPVNTINTFLERMKNLEACSQTHVLPIRTSSGCTLLLYITTNNLIAVKMILNTVCRKNKAKAVESAISMFDCETCITATKDCNFDQAMEDAIKVEVEDVEEIKDNDKTYFKFKCEFLFPDKVKSQLTNLGYSIISIEHKSIPNSVVELSDEEVEEVNKFKSKLLEVDGIKKVEDNIA